MAVYFNVGRILTTHTCTVLLIQISRIKDAENEMAIFQQTNMRFQRKNRINIVFIRLFSNTVPVWTFMEGESDYERSRM